MARVEQEYKLNQDSTDQISAGCIYYNYFSQRRFSLNWKLEQFDVHISVWLVCLMLYYVPFNSYYGHVQTSPPILWDFHPLLR